MAIIDEENGGVWQGPFRVLSFAAPLTFADKSASASTGFEPLVFRRDSRLLIARGCPHEDEQACALFYYEWDGQKFRLLQKLATALPRSAGHL